MKRKTKNHSNEVDEESFEFIQVGNVMTRSRKKEFGELIEEPELTR